MSSNFHPDGTLFIVSGPSGAGKTTLINRVRDQVRPFGIDVLAREFRIAPYIPGRVSEACCNPFVIA